MDKIYGQFQKNLQGLFNVINHVADAHLKVAEAIRAIIDGYDHNRYGSRQKVIQDAKNVLKEALEGLDKVSFALSQVCSRHSS
jgi:hypothetical protein